MKKLIIIGAGTHANSCIDAILSSKKNKILYLVSKKAKYVESYKVIDENEFIKNDLEGKRIHIGIGQLKNGDQREKIFNLYKKKGCVFPVILSGNALISPKTQISDGTIVMHQAIINRNVKIGKNCIINSGAIIEHDTIIEDNVHIAPGAIVLGGCHIKKNSFIGSAAVIRQNCIIKPKTIVPAMKYVSLTK